MKYACCRFLQVRTLVSDNEKFNIPLKDSGSWGDGNYSTQFPEEKTGNKK